MLNSFLCILKKNFRFNIRIVVGAPLANSSYLKGADSVKSGAVYKCDVTSPNSDCSQPLDQIKFDEAGKYFYGVRLLFRENKFFEKI